MVGQNVMLLNEETIKDALNEYFAKRYTEGVERGPKVLSVSWLYDVNGTHFKVQLQGRES